MRNLALIALACMLAMTAPAQTKTNALDGLLEAGEEFLRANLDDDVLQLFEQVDRDRIEHLFRDLQQRFDRKYVLDLPALKNTAQTVLPLLESHEETQPYAAWLKARLDYFTAAAELKRSVVPPQPRPGEPLQPVPRPSPALQRKVWMKQIEKRPWPKAADRFVPRLKSIFVEQQVPPELVWVAEVESSFDRRARSPAGAVGLFQLMPHTAKSLGLSLWPWDERKQVEPSARAAAQYLRYLHGRFGDWRLVLAAYNAGEDRVRTLLQKQKARTFDAIATKLPAETQMYVPKVEATLLRREGVALTELKPPVG